MALWTDLAAELAAAERWLLPGECLLCLRPVGTDPADPLVCAGCRARWAPLPEPQCARCGQPVLADVACRICSDWPAGFTGVRSAFWLDDSARRAVHLLKYQGWSRVAEPMAAALCRTIHIAPAATLIPIPLSAGRLRSRGYNQSAKLAEAIGKRLGVRIDAGTLGRGRETTTQTALTPEARRANLAGAFAARGRCPEHPVLVDDVFTTGATLAEAAQALLAAGATEVSAVTFARAARPLSHAAADPGPRRRFWSKG